MTSTPREFFLALGWTGISFFLHSTLHSSLFSLLPVPLVLSSLFAYTLVQPLPYVATLALASELYSTLPLGIMTLVIFAPWFIKRSLYNQSVDLSLLWFSVTVTSVIFQLLLIYSPDIVQLIRTDLFQYSWLPDALLTFIPWARLLTISILTIFFVYTLSIIIQYRRAV